ncbi:MAG: restriction endonuclease subunit S [Candidatus Thiodiazotropha endolucinida]|nr:restriction endonuclease subunit S [Candidatus Thiodiazotropha taylori]MCG8046528.1 restriction endonuclease subunit S [Candidatus Thiodiazotropha taylori]MCW4321371.1 restriction endonuclease subunit S [Candidatus Thiodiazotropha taylori]MCW4344240.1 restriction endonuclease subunit S [Candidatus Thiodiazotropha endolucinida]
MITLQERVHSHTPPEDWNLKKLHRVFRVRKGFKNNGMKEDNLLSLSYGRIIRKDIDSAEGLLPESFETYQIVEPGNIVMRLTDLQNDKRSLRQGLVKEKGIITSAYDALEVEKGHDPRFWAYALLALDLAKYYYSLGGGVRQSIKFADFPNDWIGAPDTETQEAIANFLDCEITFIDQLIEKKQMFLDGASRRILALVDKAISDSKVPRIRFENVVQRMQRPVELSEHGELVRLGLFNRGRGIFKKPAADEEGMGASNFFFVKSGDLILSGQFAWEGAVALATESEEGCVVSHRYPVYRGRTGVDTAYLLGLLRSSFGDFLLNEASRGSAGRNRPLNTWRLGKEKIPIPEPPHQDAVKEAVNFERRLKVKTDQSIIVLQEFRSALITGAVTGQIDVKSWRNNDQTDRRLDQIEAEMTKQEATS